MIDWHFFFLLPHFPSLIKNGRFRKFLKVEFSSGANGRALGKGRHTWKQHLLGIMEIFGSPKELFLHTPLAGEDKEGKDSNI